MEEARIIEAALFSAGQPVSIEDIKNSTELNEKQIKAALKELMKEYDSRDSSLEIAKVGDKYAMQIKPAYASHVQKFAEMEIPIKVLKTAALIAYHQPIKQSDLLGMIGYKVYDHVKILSDLGLIRRRDSGRTKLVTTTERFSEYFGISSTDRGEIKKWLMEKLNIPMPENVGSDTDPKGAEPVSEPTEQPEDTTEDESKSEEITEVTSAENQEEQGSSSEET